MAIARTYPLPARIEALLGFGGGFGAKRQEVKTIEAGAEDQRNRQLEQSVGQGIGQVGQYAFQSATIQAQQRGAMQRQRAATAAQQVGDQAATYRSQADEYQQLHGETPDAVLQAAQRPGGQVDTSGFAGPMSVGPPLPAGGPAGGVPLPFINPAATAEYTVANRELQRIGSALAIKAADPYMPVAEKEAMYRAVTPYVNELTQLVKRYPKPDTGPKYTGPDGRPVPLSHGVTALPNGGAIAMDGNGNVTFHAPPKAATEAIVPPTATAAEVEGYARSRIPNYDAVISNGGVVKVQPNGTVDVEWPPSAGEAVSDFDYSQEYDNSRKALSRTVTDAQGVKREVEPSDPEIQKDVIRKRDFERKQQQIDQEQQEMAPFVGRALEILKLDPEAAESQQAAEAWLREAKAKYGTFEKDWPLPMREKLKELVFWRTR